MTGLVLPPPPLQLSVIMLPLLVSACFAPLLMGCVSDRMGGRRKPIVYVAGVIMMLCNVALAFNRSFGWLPYIGILFGAVRNEAPHVVVSFGRVRAHRHVTGLLKRR